LEQDGGSLNTSGSFNSNSSLNAGAVLLAGGNMSLWYNALYVGGDFTVTGGTGMIAYGPATINGQMVFRGGVFTLVNPTTTVGRGVLIDTGGELVFRWSTIYTAGFVNRGMLRVLNGPPAIISGNYTQTSTGTLFVPAGSNGYHGELTVGGTATLAGTFILDPINGEEPTGMPYAVLHYGDYVGMFDHWSLPPLSYGNWQARFDDPSFPKALSLWVVYPEWWG
jgi:hypothetical protein